MFDSQLVFVPAEPIAKRFDFEGANGQGLSVTELPCLQASVAKFGQPHPIRTFFYDQSVFLLRGFIVYN